MQNNKKQNKKATTILQMLIIAGVVIAFSAADSVSEDVLFTLVGLVIMALPIIIVFWVLHSLGRKQKTEVHTHDRIDHSRDLVINPKTGQAQRPTQKAAPHSPREHWKQQLDALLANGTIDRAEYNAMLNRKF